MGYFCIDNLPPSLIPKFWELIKESGKVTKIALVIDLRSRTFFREIQDMLVELENTNFIDTTILFLDATDEELVSRYKETRRAHPMAMDGLVTEGIRKNVQCWKKSRRMLSWLLIPRTCPSSIAGTFE